MKFYITLYIEITLITPYIHEHMHALVSRRIRHKVRCAFSWRPWITLLGSCCMCGRRLHKHTLAAKHFRARGVFHVFSAILALFRSSDIHHFHMTWISWTFSCTLWPSWYTHHSAIKNLKFWDERISWNYEKDVENDRFFAILLSLNRNKRLI